MSTQNVSNPTMQNIGMLKTVQVGKFMYCQGTVVWEHEGVARVQVFSTEHVGTLL
jgi:hypothetical protein